MLDRVDKVWYNKCGQILVHISSTQVRTEHISAHKSCVWEWKKPFFEVISCATDIGNNPMVGMTVAVAVAIEEASK